jgi:hypothetical protein
MEAVIRHGVEAWAALFSNSAVLRTLIDFIHVGGLLGAGGAAIAADRATIRAARADAAARAAHLRAIHTTHRFVLGGLMAVIVSGILLFAADADTFLYSRVFWLKMVLLALLLINGTILARTGRDTDASESTWRVLRLSASASLALWFLTTLAGAALPNL